MTGDDASANGSRAAQSNPGAETRDSQHAEAQSQPQHGRQQETKTQPSSPPSSRPLPPSHQESLKPWLPLPPPHAVYPASLPVDQLHDHVETERLESPIWWHKTKLGLLLLSLMVCAVIFGIGIALGFRIASYDSSDLGYGAVDYEFGLSGGGAGLAIVVTTLEFLKTLFSRRNEGLHPGTLVAAHLIIWLVVLAAVVYTSFLNAYYRLNDQTTTFQHVLLAFDCILLLIHFVLFVDACVMTNRLNRASRGTVVVRVPIQAGAGYQGVPYPVYGYPSLFVPPQASTQPGQQPVPLMTQVPPQTAEGIGPAPPQPAALYTGYYAPAPQEQSARQLPGDQVLVQGYYAQFPAPATATATAAGPSRNSRGSPPSALAKSSGSRQSQRQAEAETQSGQQTESAAPSEGLQAQSRPGGPGSEKTL
ncbi:hypothetical protein MYCTH_2310736 [Thermothelomyces thermophilus ATCC 42464]|uniref:Uncharacterized protein n=1 Tax=Thermothelomyces thermophilus (strain ATCC 42464 / BCRC 31852 / DSM 1799) TaxID=573729 RepID=G2QLY0_THET4|nr:uncharacterized protein MYCTH_2310736 [Thermothelomyces thermophilus ATCC 42464]AEO60960.1 hypothetical protein MYCTH_2310736 [Thermothelomyces thermophilus ATCC 42464]